PAAAAAAPPPPAARGDPPPNYRAFSVIERALRRLAGEKQKPVLVIEGADRISDPEVLSVLASLAELEDQGNPLLALLLTAEAKKTRRPIPSLEDSLEAAAELFPLDQDETAAYVEHRLQIAGAGEREIFTRGGLEAVWRLTGGNPRKINRLGDMALLVGYAEKLSHIDDEVVVNLNSELIPT
ncbi:MAG: hypothetical protein IJG60_00350, partial [Thermoguttaceae bacterium]|nr:hypothetical protein [Thermoguttaceae bacterium]